VEQIQNYLSDQEQKHRGEVEQSLSIPHLREIGRQIIALLEVTAAGHAIDLLQHPAEMVVNRIHWVRGFEAATALLEDICNEIDEKEKNSG